MVTAVAHPCSVEAIVAVADAAEGATSAVKFLQRKLQSKKFADIDPEDLYIVRDMYILALKIVRSCDLEQKGYRLVINQKDDGGQQVPHLHMHLIGGENLGQMG